jgi:hypothetical protein
VRETHERTMKTMLWALAYLPFALMALLILTGCAYPTSSTDIGHPNEVKIHTYTQCYGQYHGLGTIRVVFFDERRPARNGGYVAGSAWPGEREVSYWRAWVRGEWDGPRTDKHLDALAAHEVCHSSGIWDETEANVCTVEAMAKAGCR